MATHILSDHTIQIYTTDAALQAEDAAFTTHWRETPRGSNAAADESSLAHFCAFVDFYTRKTADPFNTSLTCEKQAEAVEIAPEDVTPENMQMLMETLLETIDHLEKKWLDEQLKLEDRQRQHREDVARLSAQLGEARPSRKPGWYQRGIRAVQRLFGGQAAPKHPAPYRYAVR